MSQTAALINDSDLDRLEALLDEAAHDDVFRLDEMQAYFCAALAGPSPMALEDQVRAVLGEHLDLNHHASHELVELVRRLAGHVAAQLTDGAGGADWSLWLYPTSEAPDAPMDYGPWCMAYLHGVDAAPEDWFDALDDEQAEFLDECLYPLLVLSGEAEAAAKEHKEPWPNGEELDELMTECAEMLPDVVLKMHRFWVVRRGSGTVRRSGEKQGRNDPCACGSGKKYKQCCGASA